MNEFIHFLITDGVNENFQLKHRVEPSEASLATLDFNGAMIDQEQEEWLQGGNGTHSLGDTSNLATMAEDIVAVQKEREEVEEMRRQRTEKRRREEIREALEGPLNEDGTENVQQQGNELNPSPFLMELDSRFGSTSCCGRNRETQLKVL